MLINNDTNIEVNHKQMPSLSGGNVGLEKYRN